MLRKIMGTLVFFAIGWLPFQVVTAQHFLRLSDEQKIELALDLIRKGIQQEDTTKIAMVLAPEVHISKKGVWQKNTLTSRLQTIFDNSARRKIQIERLPFAREDNPLRFSHFWDFDILNPRITIKGDSAFVECEFSLMGSVEVRKRGKNWCQGK